jgi:riboflavin kinase
MTFKELDILKYLALKGADKQFITITTSACAKEMNISQQSVSRKILILDKYKYISRSMGVKSQKIKITEEGLTVLKKEMIDYMKIFEINNNIELEGRVVSGLGEGYYYMKEKNYRDQIIQKLNIEPFLGTLNVKVNSDYLPKLELIRAAQGIVIEGFKTEDRSFGDVIAYHAKIEEINAALIIPDRTHYTDIIEIISNIKLRDFFKLKDGDLIKITINI